MTRFLSILLASIIGCAALASCLFFTGCSGANFTAAIEDAGPDSPVGVKHDAGDAGPTCMATCEVTCPMQLAQCTTSCELNQPFTCDTHDAGGMDGPANQDAALESASPNEAGVDGPFDASDGCVLLQHDNGFGGTYASCEALGSYDQTEAELACESTGATGCSTPGWCNGSICGVLGNMTVIYVYSGTYAGESQPGFNSSCQCPAVSPVVPTWN